MMDEITQANYWTEVKDLAYNLIDETAAWIDDADDLTLEELREEVEDKINDFALHELIDSHQWIIYNYYNLQVIRYSDNEDYMADNFGSDALAETLKESGLDGLHTAIAFWCLYADVQDMLPAAWEQWEDEQTDVAEA
jgi:hypothetical protein